MRRSAYAFIFMRTYVACSRSGRPDASFRACLLLACCWAPVLGLIGAAPLLRSHVYSSQLSLLVYLWLACAAIAVVHWLSFGSAPRLAHLQHELGQEAEPSWLLPVAWASLVVTTLAWLAVFPRGWPAA